MLKPLTKLLIATAITACSVTTVAAAELKALVGGRLIDGVGNRPIANSVILITDNKITQVGTVDTLPVPAATVLDANHQCALQLPASSGQPRIY